MNTTPRILSLSHYGADLARGSAYSGALERQKDYAAYTRSYTVIVPGSSGAEEYRDAQIRIIPTGSTSVLGFIRDAVALAHALHTEEPFDVIMVDNPHIMGIVGLFLRARLGIPLIVHQMADMAWNPHYDRERIANYVKQWVMRFVMRRADMIRVSTHAEVERLRSEGIPRERIAFVPFYIDQDAFRKSFMDASMEPDPHRIVYVGRLGPQKDVATLVRALKVTLDRVPEARLTVVGTGPDTSMLERLARELGVTHAIEFIGAVPRERVAREFARASLFALPSLYEGTCMVLHEAALAGLPIVSTENAGARDFVRPDIDGILTRVRDHRAMGEVFATLLSDTALRERMSRSVQERVRGATREAALAEWANMIARVGERAQV
jgi:glycosyltransferase involved in cell wall biosynthesis